MEVEVVNFAGPQIHFLLSADDVVLLALSKNDLKLTLGWFAVEFEGMEISASKSEAMALSQRRLHCPL